MLSIKYKSQLVYTFLILNNFKWDNENHFLNTSVLTTSTDQQYTINILLIFTNQLPHS